MSRKFSGRILRSFTSVLVLLTISACGDESTRSRLLDNAASSAHSSKTMKSIMKKFPAANGEYPFSTAKDAIRREIMNRAVFKNLGEDSGFPGNEDPALLVDNPEHMVTNIVKMEEMDLHKGRVEQPWSDYYWPTYRGMLGIRFADSDFPESENWMTYFRYIEKNPATDILRDNHEDDINELSPSEKYDLIVGNNDFPLTKSMWNAGKEYYDAYQKVDSWFGLCHGWAAASFMNPRPAKAVKVRSPVTNTNILFYPSDIKGLLALLWANGDSKTRFLGGRCEEKRPATDENGRLISPDCFDVNPGAWHISVVNQLGIQKRSMIIDASYNVEVWNQPVFRYKYEFFNPNKSDSFFGGLMSRDSTADLDKAMVKIEDLERDRFKKYRDQRTRYVVGVKMEISYASEVSPSTSLTNGPDQDSDSTASYRYDLELDENKNIIGGEWHENGHPDFAWIPLAGSNATSVADETLTGTWDGEGEVPKEWNAAARQAAEQAQPLAKIVDQLVKKAQRND